MALAALGTRKTALLPWVPLMISLENTRTDKSEGPDLGRRKMADDILQPRIPIHEHSMGIL